MTNKSIDYLINKYKITLSENNDTIIIRSAKTLDDQILKLIKGQKSEILSQLNSNNNTLGVKSTFQNQLIKFRYSKDAKTTLTFIHPIGGAVTCYSHLALGITSDIKINCIQHIGHSKFADEYECNLKKIALKYAHIIRETAEAPFNLGGWSLGGVIALEIAIQLQKMGYEVRNLIVIDLILEALPNKLRQRRSLAECFLIDIYMLDSEMLKAEEFREICDIDLDLRKLYKYLINNKVIDTGFNYELFANLFKIYRDNTFALNNYLPEGSVSSIHHIISENSVLDITATTEYIRSLGSNLENYYVRGDHNTMMKLPFVEPIISIIDNLSRVNKQ